jgi:hypothetical protein
VFTPLAVAGSDVVDASKEMELVNGNLVCLDSELLVEFALSSTLDTHDGGFEGRASLGGNTQRVGAAGVCPHVGEGDLLGGSLLQE